MSCPLSTGATGARGTVCDQRVTQLCPLGGVGPVGGCHGPFCVNIKTSETEYFMAKGGLYLGRILEGSCLWRSSSSSEGSTTCEGSLTCVM